MMRLSSLAALCGSAELEIFDFHCDMRMLVEMSGALIFQSSVHEWVGTCSKICSVCRQIQARNIALNCKPLAVVTPRTKVRLRRDKFHWSGRRIPCWKLRAAVAEEAAVRLQENSRRIPGEGDVTNFGAAADRFAGEGR